MNSAAIMILSAINATGPNASTLARINIKELPQIAASTISKTESDNFIDKDSLENVSKTLNTLVYCSEMFN